MLFYAVQFSFESNSNLSLLCSTHSTPKRLLAGPQSADVRPARWTCWNQEEGNPTDHRREVRGRMEASYSTSVARVGWLREAMNS